MIKSPINTQPHLRIDSVGRLVDRQAHLRIDNVGWLVGRQHHLRIDNVTDFKKSVTMLIGWAAFLLRSTFYNNTTDFSRLAFYKTIKIGFFC